MFAEGQRGEAVCVKRAAEGLAETEARPGEGAATGGAHPQERKTQEGDGETQLSCLIVARYICVSYKITSVIS